MSHVSSVVEIILPITVYHKNHTAGTARGRTAIIIKNSIKHHELNNYSQDFLQATSVSGRLSRSLSNFGCSPSTQTRVKQEQLEDFYNTLGRRFIAGGDYNAMYTNWGSRLITTRGREVFDTMERNNLKHLSTREPTYWPSD
jgi:hypothetical protein